MSKDKTEQEPKFRKFLNLNKNDSHMLHSQFSSRKIMEPVSNMNGSVQTLKHNTQTYSQIEQIKLENKELAKTWKDKLEVVHALYRDDLLKKDWAMKNLRQKLENQRDISESGLPIQNQQEKNLFDELKGIKIDIKELLVRTYETIGQRMTRNVDNKVNLFQDICCDYTYLIREIIVKFQKCGLLFVSESIGSLWTYFMFSID